MSKQITLTVKSCRECPHSTNSAKEHDDPFTSAPANITWWCKKKNGPKVIKDSGIIDPDCQE